MRLCREMVSTRQEPGAPGGDSDWAKLPGLPASGFTRVTLGLCPAVPTTIYAGLSGNPFRLYRTTDGATFALTPTWYPSGLRKLNGVAERLLLGRHRYSG